VVSPDLDLVGHPPDEPLLADLVRLLDQILDAQFLQRMNDLDRIKRSTTVRPPRR
jgi:hypothetical protein